MKFNPRLICVWLGLGILSSCGLNSDIAAASIRLSCSPNHSQANLNATCTSEGRDNMGAVVPISGAYRYESRNPDIASIDPLTGVITTHTPGSTIITSTYAGRTSNPVEFTVDPPPWGQAQIQIADATDQTSLTGVQFEACTTADQCTPMNVITSASGRFPVVNTVYENPTGIYLLTLTPGQYYSIRTVKNGYVTAEHLNVNIMENSMIVLEKLSALKSNLSGQVKLSGRMLDAMTGAPLSGVRVNIAPRLNNFNGTPTISVTTDDLGQYTANVAAGYYTVIGAKSGYENAFSSYSVSGATQDLGDLSLSPALSSSNDWRFILDWGLTPEDLDSHITGPKANLATRYHVFYSSKTYTDALNSVNLDVDDTTSYGPETITLTRSAAGVINYSVHDYTNKASTDSLALSNSKARVRVYNGSRLIQVFNVPYGKGSLWQVFTLNLSDPSNPVIKPINKFSNVNSPTAIP